MALHEEKHGHRRHGGQKGGSRHEMPVVHELTVQGANACRDRFGLFALGQDVGPEEVIPDECKDLDGERSYGGAYKGEHHEPKNLPLRHALNTGGFH